MRLDRNRVLMLLENCSYPRDSRVRHEAETLTQHGYRVTVISPNQQRQAWREVVNGVHVYRFPAPPPANGTFGYVWEYLFSAVCIFALSLWVFAREGVDIVHAHNAPDIFFVFAPVIRLWGIQFVYDHHDLAPELFEARFDGGNRLIRRLLRRLLVWCEILSYRVAAHVIVTNESYRQIALERGHTPPERLTVVRNGPDDILTNEAKRHDGTVIVYVGSMGFHDGVEYLLRAVHCLIHDLEFRAFRCVLAGDGDAIESLKALAETLKITDWVEFKGWLSQADVKAYLRQADVCVAPEPRNEYNDHSTMIKMMEYMAAGKPIVAFDLMEHRRTASEAALYAQPNDVRDFARQILFCIQHPHQGAVMGKLGQERIATGLAWPFQEEALLSAYEQLDGRTLRRPIQT